MKQNTAVDQKCPTLLQLRASCGGKMLEVMVRMKNNNIVSKGLSDARALQLLCTPWLLLFCLCHNNGEVNQRYTLVLLESKLPGISARHM